MKAKTEYCLPANLETWLQELLILETTFLLMCVFELDQ